MEQELVLSGEKPIYAKMRGDFGQPLIIFVHGLTGHMDEHIFYNGSRVSESRGYASIRFNQYDWNDDARKLRESTFTTQARDLNSVISYAHTNGAKRIILVGHSYGCPTIMMADQTHVSGCVLWDPSGNFGSSLDKARFEPALDAYVLEWAYEIVVHRPLAEEEKSLKGKEKELIQNIASPLLIVSAGKGELVDVCRSYADHAPHASLHSIENAGHNFDENGTEEELLKATLDWCDANL
jgi:pimeloyl-ACP methyl ester carboxylesterase